MDRPAKEFLDLPASTKISLHLRSGQLDDQLNADPIQEWRATSELPTSKELMASEPAPLLVNRLDKPPKSKEEYLETHHRLYRHEGVEPLRQAIAEFRNAPGMMDSEKVNIYTQVHVRGYMLSRLGPFCRLAFSTERSPIKVQWRQANRLTPGTLVVLSPAADAFQSKCFVATIGARSLVGGLEPDIEAGEDENTPPRVDISWADTNDSVIDPTMEMVMLEAKSGYFENVRYAMLGLQHAALYQSKIDRYVLRGVSELKRTRYLEDIPGKVAVIPDDAIHFDESQMEAFESMTSDELSIVQGPPGTGKTFTSTVAIQSYVETLRRCSHSGIRSPIIISAQTNHALDQLLKLCLHRDIGKIVRLGGQSQCEEVDACSMYNLRQSSKVKRADTKGEVTRKQLCKRLETCFKQCFVDLVAAEDLNHRGLITLEQFESLTDNEWESADAQPDDGTTGAMAAWLDNYIQDEPAVIYRQSEGSKEPESSDISDPEPVNEPDDEEKYRLTGLFIPTELKRTGQIPSLLQGKAAWWYRAERYLAKCSDLYEIKPEERGIVYRYLRTKMLDHVTIEIRKLLIEYKEVCDTLKVNRWVNYLQVIQHEGIDIVGCTTTGLAKYRGLLAAMMPQVLLIEEAAETREANITSALFPSLDQLVLVGDHQQLTPHVDVRHLGAPPYNLNVSLFERLVNLKVPYKTLRTQRRMIPPLRHIVQTFYPTIEDHATVRDIRHRPPVPGMGGINLWWFQHQWPEGRDEYSYLNSTEVDMMVNFTKYLLKNGLRPHQVTFLTYYNAQVNLIKKRLRRDATLAAIESSMWSVRTVDGFQGEENDVILLSLVRSPVKTYGPAILGFVDSENRAVVATSRARRGMYIFGNARNAMERSETWKRVFHAFGEQTSYALPITCQPHGNLTEIKDPDGWKTLVTGICGKQCPTGHPSRPCSHVMHEIRPVATRGSSSRQCAPRNQQPLLQQPRRPRRTGSPVPTAASAGPSSHASPTPSSTKSSQENGITSDDLIDMGFDSCIAMTGSGLLDQAENLNLDDGEDLIQFD